MNRLATNPGENCGLGSPVAAISGRFLALPQPDGTELNVQVMAAEGERLTIWLPSVFGRPEALWALLERLPEEGIEVWLTDPIADRFLPQVNSSYEHIPPADLVSVIGAATQSTRKRIFLVGTGRGAVPVMRAGAAWRSTHPGDSRLAGLMLLSPSLYLQTPKPGEDAAYLPVVGQVAVPTLVYQPHLSSRYWHLDDLETTLRRAGAPLVVRTAPGVRDGFLGRREPLAAEVDLSARFPSVLTTLLGELEETTR